ncbi:SMC family ATPase [Jeotgalibacillus sp. ET6]|uniref:AAA family ATPase n=1 Tax=Jeotgalibacillus sp. ET6 TaxID=3037260 RepID=UPI0024189708|nr:SMC family ATPase [Jeotgalibacillus sp. ET6]MDG5473710.1 SMC family ATPase [Jeotgalibacillus sp. ET6]
MKIEKLIIKNFRIFNGTYVFDFSGKELIVISGPNGNGKSTIFDSIQWCLTGSIPRYEGSIERQKFNYIMNDTLYKDSKPQTLSVEIQFRDDEGKVHRLSRIQKKNKNGSFSSSRIEINGEKLNKTIGMEYIRELFSNTNHKEGENSPNLASFFSTTQLLSQDALEDFISLDKPNDRYKLIDEILGIRKYGIDFEQYIEQVKEIAKQQSEKTKSELTNPTKEYEKLNIQIQEKEQAILDLGQLSEQNILEIINKLLTNINEIGLLVNTQQLPIIEITNILLEELLQQKTLLKDQQISLEQLLILLKEAKGIVSFNTEDYIQQKKLINKQISEISSKQKRRENGKKLVDNKKIWLEQLRIRKNDYQSIKKDYEEIHEEILKKNISITNLINHENIKKILNEFPILSNFTERFESCKRDLDLILKIEKNIELEQKSISYLKIIEKHKNMLEIENNKSISCTSQLIEIQNEINTLQSRLTEEKESIVGQLVRQVQEHLLQSKDESKCLVCGEDYLKNEFLEQKILAQVKKANQSLTELEQNHLDFISQKSVIQEQMRSSEVKIKNIEKDISNYEKSLKDTFTQKENIPISETYLQTYSSDSTKLTNEKTEKTSFLESYKLTYNLVTNLMKLQIELKNLEKQSTPLKDSMNIILKETGSWKKYLESDENSINKEMQKYQRYISKVKEEKVKLDLSLNARKQQIENVEDKWIKRTEKIREIKKEIPDYNGNLFETEIFIQNISLNLKSINSLINDLNEGLTLTRDFLQSNEIKSLKDKVRFLKKEIEDKKQVINNYDQLIKEEIELLKRKHINVRGNLINNFLLQHSEFIDQLFSQISPHAIYRHIHLIPREKNLYILLAKERIKELNLREIDESELKQQFNASLKFSSAQANVLAVCIFLALNRSQKWTNLNFLGIDDPFQNLDDINVFSFLDVLSQVVLMQNKQLFISTHNNNFAQLLKAKMELSHNQIGSITFNSYSENGVSIKGNCIANNILKD